MKKKVIKKQEDLPGCLRRRLVFGDEEQIHCLNRTSIKIPEDVQLSKSNRINEVK